MNNYYFHSDEMIGLGHKILSLLYAYYEFDKLYREPSCRDPDVVDELRIYEEDIFKNSLLKLATLARGCDDTNNYLSNANKVFPNGVGDLKKNSQTEVLKPREACNKIIHAKSAFISYDTTNINPLWEGYLQEEKKPSRSQIYANPILTVKGTHRQDKWEAKIYLVKFIFSIALENISAWNLSGKT
ncbi:hypothetical protein [Legionella israelensis]|nr:hypothetical protein [Legionella israelensis]